MIGRRTTFNTSSLLCCLRQVLNTMALVLVEIFINLQCYQLMIELINKYSVLDSCLGSDKLLGNSEQTNRK